MQSGRLDCVLMSIKDGILVHSNSSRIACLANDTWLNLLKHPLKTVLRWLMNAYRWWLGPFRRRADHQYKKDKMLLCRRIINQRPCPTPMGPAFNGRDHLDKDLNRGSDLTWLPGGWKGVRCIYCVQPVRVPQLSHLLHYKWQGDFSTQPQVLAGLNQNSNFKNTSVNCLLAFLQKN